MPGLSGIDFFMFVFLILSPRPRPKGIRRTRGDCSQRCEGRRPPKEAGI
jgi:hypothetical protein